MLTSVAWLRTATLQIHWPDLSSLSSWPAPPSRYIMIEKQTWSENALKAIIHTFDVTTDQWTTSQSHVDVNIDGINNMRIPNANDQTRFLWNATIQEDGQQKMIVAGCNRDKLIFIDCTNQMTKYQTMTGPYPSWQTACVWLKDWNTVLTVGSRRMSIGPTILQSQTAQFTQMAKFPDNRLGHELIKIESKSIIIIYGGRSYSDRSIIDEIYLFDWSSQTLNLSKMKKPHNRGGTPMVCGRDEFLIVLPYCNTQAIFVCDLKTLIWTPSNYTLPCLRIENHLAIVIPDKMNKGLLCIGYIKDSLSKVKMDNKFSLWSDLITIIANYLLWEWLCVNGEDLSTHWKIQTSEILFDNVE